MHSVKEEIPVFIAKFQSRLQSGALLKLLTFSAFRFCDLFVFCFFSDVGDNPKMDFMFLKSEQLVTLSLSSSNKGQNVNHYQPICLHCNTVIKITSYNLPRRVFIESIVINFIYRESSKCYIIK